MPGTYQVLTIVCLIKSQGEIRRKECSKTKEEISNRKKWSIVERNKI